MKSRSICVTWLLALAAATFPVLLSAQANSFRRAKYIVTDLGTLPGGNFSQATDNNNLGLVTGVSSVNDGSQHAVVWLEKRIFDISQPGLGGPNSYAAGITPFGRVAGIAESSKADPNNENFCAYFTGLECQPFAWQQGVMTPLRLLGGNNGSAGPLNTRGQIVGMAETGTVDPDCPGTVAANGTGPQVLDFEPVIWDTPSSRPRRLKLPDGDTVGAALGINDRGQAVGTTGTCNNLYPPPFVAGPHAVFWDEDGSVHDLGNLGGTANPNITAVGNVAFAVNNRRQVTGLSALPRSQTIHAFFWSEETGKMLDLETAPGDLFSAGLAMNDEGDIVGASLDGPPPMGNARAVIWHNRQIADLNSLVAPTSLYLLTAFGINNAGQIVGFGVDMNTQEIHGFLAMPVTGDNGPVARGAIERPQLPPHVIADLPSRKHF